MKLFVHLAKAEHAASSFRKMIKDCTQFFKGNQGAFQGLRRTYEAAEGKIDEPSKREFKKIVTTVDEKLSWIYQNSNDYIDNLFTIEATNASGNPKAALMVENLHFGNLSSLELLRLKSLLETGELEEFYGSIPVRGEAEIWKPTEEEMYAGRSVFENNIIRSKNHSTEKEDYILLDPNIGKDPNYNPAPVRAVHTTNIVLGDSSYQKFSGEYSHRQRAEILRRRSVLLTEVIAALKQCNDVEAVSSEVTSNKLFNYLHYGSFNNQHEVI